MKRILMVGNDLRAFGGMSSIIRVYESSELFKKNKVYYVSSYYKSASLYRLCFFLRALFLCFFHFCTKQIDLVHIHTAAKGSFYRKSIILLLSKLFKKPVIMHVHGGSFKEFYNDSPSVIKKYIRFIFLQSIIIALSEIWQKDLQRIIGKSARIKIVHNPVHIPKKIKRGKNKVPIVIVLAKMCKAKGTYDIIQAMNLLPKGSVELHLAGVGEVKKVKQIIKQNPPKNKIKVLGFIPWEKVPRFLEASDIFALPSYFECFPVSILEASSHKLPVVATKVGGVPDAVIEGKTGFLVEPGNKEALANKILSLCKDKKLREEMGQNGFIFARNGFSIEKVVENLEAVYKEAMKK